MISRLKLFSLMLLLGLMLAPAVFADSAQEAFLQAAEKGDLKALQKLMNAQIDLDGNLYNINESYEFHSPAIVKAAEKGHYPIVEYLLKKGAKPDASVFHWTALQAAIARNDLKMVNLLLKFKADPNLGLEYDSMGKSFAGEDGVTPVMKAAQRGSVPLLRVLLAHGGKLMQKDDTGWDALHHALRVEKLNLNCLEFLLKQSFPIRTEGSYLAEALRYSNFTAVRVLLKRGVPVNLYDLQNKEPMLMALNSPSQNLNGSIEKLLLDAGANPWQKNMHGLNYFMNFYDPSSKQAQVFKDYAKKTAQKQLQALKKKNQNPNQANEAGWTPLHWAAAAGDQVFLESLLKKGADPHKQDRLGYSPLILAAQENPQLLPSFAKYAVDWKARTPFGDVMSNLLSCGDLRQVDFLLAQGLSPNALIALPELEKRYEINCPKIRNRFGSFYQTEMTPLGLATLQLDLELARFLIEKGADLNLPISGHLRPLFVLLEMKFYNPQEHQAQIQAQQALFELFAESGADLEAFGPFGSTPFLVALSQGHDAIIASLLARGVEIDRVQPGGLTPLFWAVSKNKQEWVRFLLEKGANPNRRFQRDALSKSFMPEDQDDSNYFPIFPIESLEIMDGTTLLELARKKNNPEILQMLEAKIGS